MIVEYLGIPGSGKTFFANQYKFDLRSSGVKYIDLSRCKASPVWLKVFYKFAERSFVFIPKYRRIKKQLLALSKKEGCNREPQYLPFSLNYCIDRILLCVLLQDMFGSGEKIAINDEGLLQWIVFLNLQYKVPLRDIMKYVPLSKDCYTKFIICSIETALDNIKRRNRHDCPMDEMPEPFLRKYLDFFLQDCLQLEKFLDARTIERMDRNCC